MSQIQKSISLSEKTWKIIDALRKDIPRSRFVARIVTEGINDSEDII